MSAKPHFALLSAGLLALAACAQPEPEPVRAQPVYDKYGNATYSECRGADVQITTANVNIPPCLPPEEDCPLGQVPAQSTAAAGFVCVPRDDGDPQGQRGGQQQVPGRP